MSVELIGMIGTRDRSETRPPTGQAVQPDYLRRFARAHEDAGFDRVLVAVAAAEPDALQVGAYAASVTERLGLLIAHRPGFVAPTVAARAFATLDQLTGGRVAMHVISGGNDAEQRRDGDFLTKDERYARTDEYLDIVRRAWGYDQPFDHEGAHYRVEGFRTDVHPHRHGGIPIYFGGASEAALRVGGRHADVYALWGEPLAETREQIARVRAAAQAAGRTRVPGISVSFRPILGATEAAAWERAERILARAREHVAAGSPGVRSFGFAAQPENAGSQRILAAAERQDRHDRALYTAIARATGAPGNSTALVGTPETVARALLDYVDLGATTLLLRGYDPYDDVVDYGRHLLPLLRQELAHRERTAVPVPAPTAQPPVPALAI
jgi:alkanesulfonate monooxygenase